MSEDVFSYDNWVWVAGSLLASSGKSPEMLINTRQCTGQPRVDKGPIQMSIMLKLRTLGQDRKSVV